MERGEYLNKMTEGFMDMAGSITQQLEQTEALFQNALRMLEDLNNTPYTGDHETDHNRNQEVQEFISQYKRVDRCRL